jgi:hypothetical protein
VAAALVLLHIEPQPNHMITERHDPLLGMAQSGDVAQGVWLAVVLLAEAGSFGAAPRGLDPEVACDVVLAEEDVSTCDSSPSAVPPVPPSSFHAPQDSTSVPILGFPWVRDVDLPLVDPLAGVPTSVSGPREPCGVRTYFASDLAESGSTLQARVGRRRR